MCSCVRDGMGLCGSLFLVRGAWIGLRMWAGFSRGGDWPERKERSVAKSRIQCTTASGIISFRRGYTFASNMSVHIYSARSTLVFDPPPFFFLPSSLCPVRLVARLWVCMPAVSQCMGRRDGMRWDAMLCAWLCHYSRSFHVVAR